MSIADAFARRRDAGQIALMPFIAAGYPDLATSMSLLPALQAGGASLIEVGFPFSDPIADGPVIQQAFTEALAKRLRIDDIFAGVAQTTARRTAQAADAPAPVLTIPLVAMISYSIVYRYGVERFIERAKSAGFAGLILPDLPPPEAQDVCKLIREGGLETVLLVSPATPPPRRREIAALSSGFIYYLSLRGITGERDELPADLEANVRELAGLSQVPVAVGFGINLPRHVRQLRGVADGAIVGTAFVRRVRDAVATGDSPAAVVESFCRELLAAE